MRKWLTALLAAALLLAAAPPVRAAGPDIAAPSAILMDAATGTVLYEKNASERLRPASVTKVMTLLLVMEALDTGRIGWDDTVIASEAACAKGGSQVYLEPGEEMSMDEMLKSVVVSSANDCATALAEHVAGSESAFVGMMNQRAQELGLLDTNFVNCTGLDDAPEAAEHLTTAHDIAVISRELLKHDRIRDYTTIWMDTVRGGKFGLSNTNKLVRFYQGTTGLKTGYTSAAGHCLAASAKRDGIELIAVVLHCTSSADRFSSAKALLDYGFANYAAALYLAYADGDRANCPQDAADLTVTALAGGITELDFGDVTRGALCDAVPAGQRLVLARTTSVAIGALIDTGTVTRTYEESLTAFEPTDGDALVVTDTATLEALEQAGGSYTILRDYGDVFWDIRMNINDVTNNFANPFTLPEAPQRGAGRK